VKHVAFECWTTCEPIYATPADAREKPIFSITAILTLALASEQYWAVHDDGHHYCLRPFQFRSSSLYQVFGHNANRIKFGSFSIR